MGAAILGPVLAGPQEIPVLVDDNGTIVNSFTSDARHTQTESDDLESLYNNVDTMPDDWYWRNKPLSKNSIKVGQKYWVD